MKLILMIGVLVLSFLNLPQVSAQEVRSEIQFKKIVTNHFDILFDSRQQKLAENYATRLEWAWQYLSKELSSLPEEKVVVIINDKTDVTNGYATILPYPHIMIYPVLPGVGESLSESGDWSLELLAHEFTHILNFVPVGEGYRVLRGIFGSIIAPNLLLPSWFKEGAAVQVESSVKKHGRLLSVYQDSILRAYSLDNKLGKVDISTLNDAIPIWPEGMGAYLFGSVLWSQMMADTGGKALHYLFQRHSETIPYIINKPAREILNKSYEGEFIHAMEVSDSLVKEQLELLKSKTPSELNKMDIPGVVYTSRPSVSPDGQYLALVGVDDSKKRSVMFFKKMNGQFVLQNLGTSKSILVNEDSRSLDSPYSLAEAPPSGTIGRLNWFHRRPILIFDRVDPFSRNEKYSDIYTYDVQTGQSQSLGRGLRARDPSISPNDLQIAFIQLGAGTTSLATMDSDGKNVKVLFAAPLLDRLSTPVFLDEKTIVYAHRNQSGIEQLYRFDLEKSERTLILEEHKQATQPLITSKGLMFLSAQNGIYNLYLADGELKEARPLTHVLTTVLNSGYDSQDNKIYLTSMTSSGPWVHVSKPDFIAENLPRIRPLFADRYTLTASQESLPPPDAISLGDYKVEEYSPTSYLWPRYWIPFVGTSSQNGSTLISAQTSGFDPLKKHVYNVSLNYNTFNGFFDYSLDYTNSVTSLPWTISTAKLGTFLNDGSVLSSESIYGVGASPDVFWLSPNLSVIPSWIYDELKLTARTEKSMGPSLGIAYQNYSKAGIQISPESGHGLYLSHSEFIKQNEFTYFSRTRASGILFFNRWLPTHHVLFGKLNLSYIPTWNNISYLFGTSNASMFLNPHNLSPTFVMRGFLLSQFIGLRTYNMNLEYRLPLRNIFKGKGTKPIFFHQLYGSIICDIGAIDGVYYNQLEKSQEIVTAKKVFSSTGIEVKLDTTVGYLLPLTWVLGVYLPQGYGVTSEIQYGTSLQIGSI